MGICNVLRALMIPIYILIFGPILFYLLPIKFKGKDKRQNVIEFFLIILFLLLALRHSTIGNDTLTYLNEFDSISWMSWEQIMKLEWEIGFVTISKLISIFVAERQLYLMILSLLIVAPILYVYSKNSEYPVLIIAIFLILPTFTMMFSGLRQAIAISIGLMVFESTKRRRLILSLLLVFLAMTFHKSAFMLFLVYPVYHMRIGKKTIPIIVGVFLTVFFFNKQIFAFFENMVYGMYETTSTEETGAYTMLILFALFAIFSFLIPKEDMLGVEGVGLRNLLVLACLFQCFVPLHNLAMRVNYYFIIFIPILMPKVIKAAPRNLDFVARIANVVMSVFFIIFFLIRALSGNVTFEIFPYYFCWEEVGLI